jgi:ribose transport system permease protein
MSSAEPASAEEITRDPDIDEDDWEYRPPWWAPVVAGSSRWIGIVLVGLLLVFSILEPSGFLSVANARNLGDDAAVLLVLAVGETFVTIMAGIDLSCGSILVFAGVMSAKAMGALGGNNWGVILVGLLVALAAGGAWGLINGVLVGKAKINSFVVTLGTLGMSLGIALVVTGGVDVQAGVPFKLVSTIGAGRLAGQVPWLVVIAVAATVVFGVVLRATLFGRYTYAIGSNGEAAARSGISVDWHIAKVFGLAGVLYGLAGFLSLARFDTTTVAGHSTDNLQAITAVVIGGASLFGGIGTMLGSFFGVLIPSVLQNGFVIAGVQPFWQQVAVGAVLIFAVYLDRLRRKSRYS